MKVNYFQQGGMMPQEDPYAEGGMEPGMDPGMGMEPEMGPEGDMGGSPEEEILMMAEEIINQVGPEVAMMLAEAIAMIVQQGGGGGMPQEEPVYARKGGRLQRVR